MDFPTRSTFVQTVGGIFMLKTKAPGTAVAGKGEGELITHTRAFPGVFAQPRCPRPRPPAAPSAPAIGTYSSKHRAPRAAKAWHIQQQMVGTYSSKRKAPIAVEPCRRLLHHRGLHLQMCLKAERRRADTPAPSRQQSSSIRISFASRLSKQTKKLPLEQRCLRNDLFPLCLQARRTKLWQNLTAALGDGKRGHLIAAVEAGESVQGLGIFCWCYFAGTFNQCRGLETHDSSARPPARVSASSDRLRAFAALRAFKCCSQPPGLVQATFCKG